MIPKPPFPWDLSPERERTEFERLKPQLASFWSTAFPRDELPYTSVVVPSISLDAAALARMPGAVFREERLLFLLIRLRNPRARLVYVTSRPLHPLVLEYYLQLLAGIPASHARARLTLLSAHDASDVPLSQKILQRPRLLQRIRAAIRDPSLVNTAIDPRREPPLRFLILDGAPEVVSAGGVLVLTWFHPFMDPRGAQNLLHHLVHLDRHAGDAPWGSTVPAFVRAADPRPFKERGRLARKSLEYMRTLPRALPVSPAKDPAGRVCFRQVSFAEREIAARPSRVTQEVWWRLAVVGKAMRGLGEQRSFPDVPFLLPIAVDLRPKGDLGPTFGNMLAFHFARFRPSDAADVPRLASVLRDQMADAVRGGQIEANDVAMDFLQYRPLSFIRRALRRTGGETFSFNCADVTDFPAALDRCFGGRVVNAYHVPAVPPRPGIGVFFNRCAGRSNLVVAWIDGVVTDDDVTRIVEIVREGMGWIETS